MLRKVTRCTGHVLANTRPHQLHWGDQEMGTAISCTECSQVAGLIQKLVETPRKHRLFVQLFFMQLSFVRRSCIAIVIIDRHVYVLSVRKCMHVMFCIELVTTSIYNEADTMRTFPFSSLQPQLSCFPASVLLILEVTVAVVED